MVSITDPDALDPFDPQTDKVNQANVEKKFENDEKHARMQLEQRKGAFMRVFVSGSSSSEDRELVLKNLKRFCRFNQSVFTGDDRLTCLLLGRQEVALRIDDFISKSVDELIEQYANMKVNDV